MCCQEVSSSGLVCTTSADISDTAENWYDSQISSAVGFKRVSDWQPHTSDENKSVFWFKLFEWNTVLGREEHSCFSKTHTQTCHSCTFKHICYIVLHTTVAVVTTSKPYLVTSELTFCGAFCERDHLVSCLINTGWNEYRISTFIAL